jgi:cyclopropane-fatty-acyl-phospholipid synthase
MTVRISDPDDRVGRRSRGRTPMAAQITDLLGDPPDLAVRAYDGSRSGPADPAATLVVVRPQAITRLVAAPGELGFARALVSGDLVIEGDLVAALELRHHLNAGRGSRALLRALLRLLLTSGAPLRKVPPPPEETQLQGRRHTKGRDAQAVSHHYDVGNDFYRLLLGPTMTYSCAVWASPDTGLDAAQEAKHELVAAKLGLGPGDRLLDVGCGWGGMLLTAARRGAHGVGITLSEEQAEGARRRIAEAGLADQLEVRIQDYRDVDDGPFDAISSIGMVEHVGDAHLDAYASRLYGLLRPGGRLLNHGITARFGKGGPLDPRGFMQRYIFPDGELQDISRVTAALQGAGFEVRNDENLREHYALTLRAWLANLEANWDDAVALVGEGRALVWRLYVAGCIVGFEDRRTELHQVLAVRDDRGRSGLPLRPHWS